MLPKTDLGDNAVLRGDDKRRFLATGDGSWNIRKISVPLNESVGLAQCGKVCVIQRFPTEKTIGCFAYGETAEISPCVDQIRLCPGDVDEETISACTSKGILIEGYSVLGTGKALSSEPLAKIAERYGVNIPQLCIRWCLQNGFVPLARSVSPKHIKQNLDVFGFDIEPSDMVALSEMVGECGVHENPDERQF